MHIAVIAGTTRADRKSIHAARFVYEIGKTLPDINVEVVNPVDFEFPGDGNEPEGKNLR